MAPPPIQLMLTTIASQPALRQRQEYLLRVLQVKKIPFTSYDLASDEDAKKLWRRKAPADKQQLPGIIVGGSFPGTFAEFEEAVEYGELDIFLRRNEEWEDDNDAKSTPPAKPVGVPGAYSPSQMHPKYNPPPSPHPAPSPLKGKGKEDNSSLLNAGEHLSEFGLHDVEVSADDLRALVEELGLGGDEANDLVIGLGPDSRKATKTPEPVKPAPNEEAKPEVESLVKQETLATITKTSEPASIEEVKPNEEPSMKQETLAVIESETEVEEPKSKKEESKDEAKGEAKEDAKVQAKAEMEELNDDTKGDVKDEVQEVKEAQISKKEDKEEEKAETGDALTS